MSRISVILSSPRHLLGALLVALLAVGAVVGSGASFTSKSANSSNTFSAGSLDLAHLPVERSLVRRLAATAISLSALAACLLAVGFSAASFSDTSTNSQAVSAIADWVAPSAGASAIVRSQEGAPAGYIKAGGTYYVYANVTDSGNPASGVASVKANVESITTGKPRRSFPAGMGPARNRPRFRFSTALRTTPSRSPVRRSGPSR